MEVVHIGSCIDGVSVADKEKRDEHEESNEKEDALFFGVVGGRGFGLFVCYF